MGDLQATIEFLVELYKFYNVDLFIRGYYQFQLTFKPPKSSHAIQVEVCEAHGERGAFTLFPAFITNDGQTAVSRTFNIYYKDEEVLLKDVFLFRVHLLIDSTKAADCIDKTALEMTVDVHFTDQVVREENYRELPLVTSRTLKFHFSCFNGLHHQVPLLFDYYYFSVLDMIIHASIVSLGLPNWSILKQVKTGWFSKSIATPRSSTATPLFYTTLFGNRSQLGSQVSQSCEHFMEYWGVKFYNDVALRYAVSSPNSITREHFQKASAVHRNLCAILAMAHSQLLNYFDEMMQYLDHKQRIKLAEKLDPADLVEGLCKKLETLQSCEEVFDEMCSDMSVLNNELALLWLQFQESFTLNDQIRPLLREQHHRERMMHFSEAFFVHQIPWKSLLNDTDSSFQKHVSMGQCVKSSKYLAMIPPVTIECAECDGDASSTPIFFEDCYVNRKEPSVENVYAAHIHQGIEDDVLEHKPLSFGILNKAFRDSSSPLLDSAGSSDVDRELDPKDVWVDVKTSYENDVNVARETHAEQNASEVDCEVTDKTERDCEEQKGTHSMHGGDGGVSQDKTNNSVHISNLMATTNDEQAVCKNDCDVKSKEGNETKTMTSSKSNSEKSLTKYTETRYEANDKLKDKSDTEVNLKHCGTMLSTVDNGSDTRDVSDIAIIDNTVEDRTRTLEAGIGSVVDPPLGDESQKSYQNIDGDVLTPKKSIEQQISTVGGSGSSTVPNGAALTDLTGDQDSLQPGESTCLVPNSNTETAVESVEAVASNDRSLGTDCGKEVSPRSKEEQNKASVNDMTGNHVIARCTIAGEAEKKVSLVKYIGSNDTTNCGELASNCKSGASVSEPRLETCSKEKLPDKVQGIPSEKDKISDTKSLGNNPGVVTLLILSENRKTESAIKEPEPSNLTNSSSQQSVEATSDTIVTSSSISSSSFKSNTDENFGNTVSKRDKKDNSIKRRNTAQISVSKRVSNSVFYEGIVVLDAEENCTEQKIQNKQISSVELDTVRLSSNSSSEVISCFCAGKLKKVSSPYKPTSESDASNLVLQKAKQDVISRMNYCGTLYSDSNTEFVVRPYFINPKPDLSMEPVHFVVCVHGLEGNSGDLRLVRCFLEMTLPSTKFEFLMSEVNQDNTFVTFEKLTEKLVSEILHHMEAFRISPSRISFIGHSLGNIIIRSVLNHPLMGPYVELFHTFLSLSGPHLGMVHHTSSLVSTGMWLLQKWKKSESLLQLSLNDSTDMRDTFIYKLSKKKGLEHFTNVLLVSSVQDHYVPFHSSRIELPKTLRSSSQECIVYREMMENLLTPLLSKPNRTLVRYSVYHCLPSSTNTFIGRAAHIAMLDSELFIEKLICTSAAKYFQ